MGDFFSFSKFFFYQERKKKNLKNGCPMPAKSEDGLSHTPHVSCWTDPGVSFLHCAVPTPWQGNRIILPSPKVNRTPFTGRENSLAVTSRPEN